MPILFSVSLDLETLLIFFFFYNIPWIALGKKVIIFEAVISRSVDMGYFD